MARSRTLVAGITVVTALGLGAVSTACSSSSDSSAATTTTAKSSNGTVPKSFSVSVPEGEVSLSLDGQLPPNWPSSFPVPDGAEPAGSGSLAKSESGVQVGVFSTSEAGQGRLRLLQRRLRRCRRRNVKSTGIGNAFVGTLTLGGSYEGTVWVGGYDGTTYIVVVLTGSSGAGGTSNTSARRPPPPPPPRPPRPPRAPRPDPAGGRRSPRSPCAAYGSGDDSLWTLPLDRGGDVEGELCRDRWKV